MVSIVRKKLLFRLQPCRECENMTLVLQIASSVLFINGKLIASSATGFVNWFNITSMEDPEKTVTPGDLPYVVNTSHIHLHSKFHVNLANGFETIGFYIKIN